MKPKQIPLLIAGAFGVGALTMYFADPDRGKRRRALAKDACVHSAHELQTLVVAYTGISNIVFRA